MAMLVVKVPLLLNTFVQTGVQVLNGAVKFVLVYKRIVPPPELVAVKARLLPEMTVLPTNFK